MFTPNKNHSLRKNVIPQILVADILNNIFWGQRKGTYVEFHWSEIKNVKPPSIG